jgi:hypothetical protein
MGSTEMEDVMIKWKESKKVPTKSKRHNGWVTKIMVGRVCDKCGKEEDAFWGTVKKSRERRGEETDYCYQCSQIGRNMPTGPSYKSWKHGLTHNGYVRVTKNGKRVLEHVMVMEEHLGRRMNSRETVHHIDMDKRNNILDNLFVFDSQSKHQECHTSMERCACKLLNQFFWFDWNFKQYTFTQMENRVVANVEIPKIGKLYLQRGYLAYNEKDIYGRRRNKMYHILVAEKMLGRRLLRDEVVHHIDGDKINNDPSNLCVMDKIDHHKCHCALQRVVVKLYQAGVVVFDNGVYRLAAKDPATLVAR